MTVKKILILILSVCFSMLVFAQKKLSGKEAENRSAAQDRTKKLNTDDAEVVKSFIGNSANLREVIKNKRSLSEKDLKNKSEGFYVTPLPLFNVDADNGVGYGIRVLAFYNGKKDDVLFLYTPYRHRISAQFFQTRNGMQFHIINYDAPYIMNTRFRIRGTLTYDKNINENFFGIGTRAMGTSDFGLRGPDGIEYSKFQDYNTAIRQVSDGRTDAKFNKYSYERPTINLFIEHDSVYFLWAVIRPQIGFTVSKVNIHDYTNATVDTTEGFVKAVQNNTLLRTYENNGLLTGFNGGWDNTARLALAYDSRDFEPDPNKGIFAEVVAEFSDKALGSAFSYSRYTFSSKGYYSPIPDIADLVLALRIVYSFYMGTVPFYSLNQIGFTEINRKGLGGLRTLRGFKRNRFVGKAIGFANLEFRYTFVDFKFTKQHFALMIVPFFDLGRAFDDVKQTTLRSMKYNYGAGFRIAWNKSTIVMIDYALSDEGGGLFINFNHIF